MTRITLAVVASFAYGLATFYKARFIFNLSNHQWLERSFALLALLLHATFLYVVIDSGVGQNLTFFNLLAQVAWLIALIAWAFSFWRPLSNLCLLTYPFAIICVLLALIFPGSKVIITAEQPLELVHILLAMTAFSLLCLAGMQALVSVVQEHFIAYREGFSFLNSMPPLETTERLLFALIGVGFILLSLVVITSFYFFPNPFSPALLHKTLITIVTWLVFAALLLGRHFYGWRGPMAIRWTGLGILLMLILLIFSALEINFNS